MFENLYPLGTIVKLKKSVPYAMIIGFMQVNSNSPNIIYDYVGVIYPAGSVGINTQFMFNNEDISEVVFRGYTDSKWDDMISSLEKEITERPELAERLRLAKKKSDEINDQ